MDENKREEQQQPPELPQSPREQATGAERRRRIVLIAVLLIGLAGGTVGREVIARTFDVVIELADKLVGEGKELLGIKGEEPQSPDVAQMKQPLGIRVTPSRTAIRHGQSIEYAITALGGDMTVLVTSPGGAGIETPQFQLNSGQTRKVRITAPATGSGTVSVEWYVHLTTPGELGPNRTNVTARAITELVLTN